MDLIYQHKKDKQGSIWQCGYREIPHDLKSVDIHVVIYAASECPPLNHHKNAELCYFPNEDMMCPLASPTYEALLNNAKPAVAKTVNSVREGKNVLVTCHEGLNRSGLVTGLAISALSDMPKSEIISLVQERRQGALYNGVFKTMVLAS